MLGFARFWVRHEGIHHARRKGIYERLHPEAKVGAKGGWHNNKSENLETDNMSVSSYATDAANAVGEAERTVRRKTRIGEQLAEVAEQLQGTAIEDNQGELLALAHARAGASSANPAIRSAARSGRTFRASAMRDPVRESPD